MSVFSGPDHGDFTRYRGATDIRYLVRLDVSSGDLDASFAPVDRGFNRGVHVLSFDPNISKLYVGGEFSSFSVASVATKYLAKLSLTSGQLDTLFSQPDNVFDGAGYVYDLAIHPSNNSLYVAGGARFYRGRDIGNPGILKLDMTTGIQDTNFSDLGKGFTSGSPSAFAIHSSNNSIYVTGSFSQYRGQNVQGLAKLDLDTGALDTVFTHLGSGLGNCSIWGTRALAIHPANNSIYVGSDCNQYRGTPNNAQRLAKLDLTSGNLDTNFTKLNSGFDWANDYITELIIHSESNSLYVGGRLSSYRGVTNRIAGLAKLDLTTGNLDTTFNRTLEGGWGPSYSMIIFALSIVPSIQSLYVGGNFSSYRGTTVQNFAKIDLASGDLDTDFAQAGGGLAGGIYGGIGDMAPYTATNSLVIVGDFTRYQRSILNAQNILLVDPLTGNKK